MSTRRLVLLFFCILSGQAVWAGPNVAIDNILMSKTNGVATAQIWPACKMRYIDHLPVGAGLELRIRVRADGECAALLQDVTTEAYRPDGDLLGNITEVIFDALGTGDNYITLHFSKPSQFEVRQHPVGWIEVFVDTRIDSRSLPANIPPPLYIEPEVPREPPAFVREPTQRPRQTPLRQQVVRSRTGEFVVQLGVFESVDAAAAELLRIATPHFVYATEFRLNGKTWHGLQVGFFDSEPTAELVLEELRSSFPDSWVRYVSPREANKALDQGELYAANDGRVPAVRITRSGTDRVGELSAQMNSGRQALLDRRYGDAIDNYTQVLEYPDHEYRGTAREYIGIAHERSGQSASAIAEYQAYLLEFPDAEGADRVETRLVSLLTATSHSTGDPQPIRASQSDGWQLYGGISQYYWRNEEQLVHDGNRLVSSSGVLALADFTASRRGNRFDILARMNGGYQFNLVEFDAAGDSGWMSYAYVDVADHRTGLRGTIGRQTRRSDGVLGRFDGAAVGYQWKPDIHFSVSAGIPVDSPRYIGNADRFFYAASAQIDELWGKFSVSAYTHQQTVDGLSDRAAVGGEIRYREGPLNLVGLVDYDASYNVLNTALLNGVWLLKNDWRVNASVRFGAQPYLTTRNALAGQTARSVEELLETYTKGQIRTLARDRTSQSTTASVGLSIPLSERLDLSLDVTTRQSDATIASGGVAAIPDTGAQMFYNVTLVGSSLLKQGDLTIVTLRHETMRTRDSSTLIIDSRLPFGEALRINPRVTLTQRTAADAGTEQLIVSPSIRVIYRWNRLMIDLEAGGRWSSRDLPLTEWDPFTRDGTEELLGGFVNLGYRLEF